MQQETVQIGDLVFSKTIIDIAAPLLGTLIGGIITYLSTTRVESRKWREAQHEKLQEQRRQALAAHMEINRETGVLAGNMDDLAQTYLSGQIDEDDYKAEMIKLYEGYAIGETPAYYSAFLLPEVERRAKELIIALNSFTQEGDTTEQRAKRIAEGARGVYERTEELKKLLQEEYRKTFGS